MISFVKRLLCFVCIGLIFSAAACDFDAYALLVVSADEISAKSAILIDAQTGRIIWGKNENERLPMASTTKIMTTILTLESGDLDTEFTVDSEAIKTEGSSMGLVEGDVVTKRDLCIGMLLPSGNDAANCAAVKVGGDRENFAKLMNQKADMLGMTSSHFVTPSGLHDDDHYSTARDMAVLAAYALKNPDFAEICSQTSISLDFGIPPFTRWLKNTNKLLSMYDGCIGVKTGFTDEAGRCLVSAVERDGITLICVTLNAPDDWNDHIKLYDYGFQCASRLEIVLDEAIYTNVVGSNEDTLQLIPSETAYCTQIAGQQSDITWKAVVPQIVYAPVKEGDIIGTAVIYDNGTEVADIPLAAAKDCNMITDETDEKKVGIISWLLGFFK